MHPGQKKSRLQNQGRDGCIRIPRTAGRSGCTPAEPYPPNRKFTLHQKKEILERLPLTNHIPVYPWSKNCSTAELRLSDYRSTAYIHVAANLPMAFVTPPLWKASHGIFARRQRMQNWFRG